MAHYKYFSNKDFKNSVPSCDILQMDMKFLDKLDQAREFAGVPFKINSAFRTVEHEKSKGRSGTSSHCKGLAVDIAINGSRDRFKIVQSLIKIGFTRIGIGKTFVHVDLSVDKAQEVMFDYY